MGFLREEQWELIFTTCFTVGVSALIINEKSRHLAGAVVGGVFVMTLPGPDGFPSPAQESKLYGAWAQIIMTCVTVGACNKSWTTIFTAYFFAGILMLTLKGPDGRIMAESKAYDGWGLTFCIPILTRFFIECVRSYVNEEVLRRVQGT